LTFLLKGISFSPAKINSKIMTTIKNNKIFELLTLVIFLSAFTLPAYSQAEEGVIDTLVLKLQQKVLLTQDQSDRVKGIMVNYFNEPFDINLNTAKEKIEALLDNRQKAKYEIIKTDWWKSVIKEAKDSKSEKK
jgi:hypothetical protein